MMRKNTMFRKYIPSLLLFLLFELVAITLWIAKYNIFYLLNFSYIGGCLALGTALFGPLLFGRGWCGYACWTAMVLDFLPYKQPKKPRKEKLGVLRYVMFVLSLAVVLSLFLMKIANLERIMFWIFLVGNTFYYIVGIVLAFVFKDNRAFCKYLCPVTVFLKPMSYFSLLRVHCDENKCIHCGKCLKVCPMNVEVNKESRKRKNGTECILCYECTKVCPTKALH